MARPASGSSFTIAQLEQLVHKRRVELGRLARKRATLQKRMDVIDAKIAEIGGGASIGRGGPRRGPGSRVKNSISLQDLIHQILSKSSQPLGVGDITDKAIASGYKSNAANFRGIVNQALLKDKRFVAASRGLYKLK